MTAESLRRLGTFDLEKVTLFIGNHNDPAIGIIANTHERIHEALTYRTSYGLLTNKLKQLFIDTRASGDASKAEEFRRALMFMVDNARVVQEAAATYVGLAACEREDLVHEFPAFYISAFETIRDVAERFFQTPLLRCQLAEVVARISLFCKRPIEIQSRLLTNPSAITSHFQQHELPDQKFHTLVSCLMQRDPKTLRATLQDCWLPEAMSCRTEEEFFTTICDGNVDRLADELTRLQDILLYALDELVRPEFPDIDELASEYRQYRLIDQMRMVRSEIGSEFQQSESGAKVLTGAYWGILRGLSSRTILWDDVDPPVVNIVEKEMPRIGDIISRMSKRLDVAYAYFARSEDTSRLYLADSPQVPGVLDFYSVSSSECEQVQLELARNRVPLFTVMEELSLYNLMSHLRKGTEVQTDKVALGARVFIHIRDLGLPFIKRLKDTFSVRWTAYQLGYQQLGIGSDGGLYIVLFWPREDPNSGLFFQLANVNVVTALRNYTDYLNHNNERFEYAPSEGATDPVDTGTLAKLVDHPVFNYYWIDVIPEELGRIDR